LHTIKHCLHFGSTGHSITIALSLDDEDHRQDDNVSLPHDHRQNFQECNGIITVLDMPMFVDVAVTKGLTVEETRSVRHSKMSGSQGRPRTLSP
jgi:hypothetical protein